MIVAPISSENSALAGISGEWDAAMSVNMAGRSVYPEFLDDGQKDAILKQQAKNGHARATPEMISGTHTPVWYTVPFALWMSNGTFTPGPKVPLSPMMITIVFVCSGW